MNAAIPLPLCAALFVLWTSLASAAPSASCASKFVGAWTVRVLATGQTYPAVISPSGTTHVTCPMCTPTGTWTCSGNTITILVNAMAVSHTLSPDGRTMTGGCCTLTRAGRGPAVARARSPNKPESAAKHATERTSKKKDEEARRAKTAAQQPAQGKPASRRSASCSDITGTSSKAPAASHCRDADRSLYAARQIRQSNPQVAAAEYKKAAAAARRAGDNTLELSILREAMEPAAAVVAAVTASAPAAPATATPSQPSAGGVPRMWDGNRDTCGTANNLERRTASYHVMCDPPQPSGQAGAHRPNPDPRELSKQARHACGSYSRDTQRCFADFKLKAILANNPGLQEACEKKAADRSSLRRQLSERLNPGRFDNRGRFLECVDNVYLYGSPDGPPLPKNSLREALRKRLAATGSEEPKYAADRNPKPSMCWSPGRCCQPGYGLKPTPGAFGAWSCQPLGLLALNANQPRLSPKDQTDLIEDFEERVNESVAKAVAAALEAAGPALSESDRDACTAASFAALHAMLKGSAPGIPEQCRTMASGARGYFALYADGHVDNSNSAMEDLLASFGSDLGAPLPGMIGLTPDENARRTSECLLRGGSTETCN